MKDYHVVVEISVKQFLFFVLKTNFFVAGLLWYVVDTPYPAIVSLVAGLVIYLQLVLLTTKKFAKTFLDTRCYKHAIDFLSSLRDVIHGFPIFAIIVTSLTVKTFVHQTIAVLIIISTIYFMDFVHRKILNKLFEIFEQSENASS